MPKSARQRARLPEVPLSPGDVTALLLAWSAGDRAALDQLMPLVYGRLRALAASFLRHERQESRLETAALVHEAYLRLIDQSRVRWHDRAHFFAICARCMRRILVDHARHETSIKRGGDAERLPIDELRDLPIQRAREVAALDQALLDLERCDAEQAKIVELRYFGGMNRDEIATFLGISSATVTRRWRMARAWLYHYLVREERLEL